MDLVNLSDQIAEFFDLGDLRDLCFRLGIKYENIRGDTLTAKSQELTEYCRRYGLLKELVEKCSELRPQIGWSDPQLIKPTSSDKSDPNATRLAAMLFEVGVAGLKLPSWWNEERGQNLYHIYLEAFSRVLYGGKWGQNVRNRESIANILAELISIGDMAVSFIEFLIKERQIDLLIYEQDFDNRAYRDGIDVTYKDILDHFKYEIQTAGRIEVNRPESPLKDCIPYSKLEGVYTIFTFTSASEPLTFTSASEPLSDHDRARLRMCMESWLTVDELSTLAFDCLGYRHMEELNIKPGKSERAIYLIHRANLEMKLPWLIRHAIHLFNGRFEQCWSNGAALLH